MNSKKQIVGVAGGVIEPTEVAAELFKKAVKFRKDNIGKEESLTKINLSKMKYNRAWKHAIVAQNENQ
ncbi:MAG: hypothetical protein GDA51_04975 [Ekhidna sp.]|nr:hypothetical protein [Ekhidna sp.]MBC6425818.1 hypothetical protein [Ekhidna sp.]